MKSLAVVLLCVTGFSALLPAGEEAPATNFHVYSWVYSRERKTITGSNRVTAEFMLKNLTGKNLDNVSLTVTYMSGLGEKAADPIVKKVGAMKADEAQKIKVVQEFIPIFTSYQIAIDSGDGKPEEWFSSSDVGQPNPRNGEPLHGVASLVILGKEATANKQGQFAGQVRVKNEGTAEAKNVKIAITFYDVNKKKMGEWSGKLAGSLMGGAEENMPFVMPIAPKNYGSYEMKTVCDDTSAEAALSGGDFTNAAEVEFAKFAFARPDPKGPALNVKAQVRNGLADPVGAVKLTLIFSGANKKELKRFTYEVPGKLKAGEIKPVEFAIPALPPYEAFEQKIDYDTAGDPKSAEPGAKQEAAKPKFKNIPDIEIIFTEAAENDDKSVSLLGAMRNGKDKAVKDVEITVTFQMPGSAEPLLATKILPDVAKPGEERNFVLKAEKAAGFKGYSYKFKFTGIDP